MSRPKMSGPVYITGSYIPLILAAWVFTVLAFLIAKYAFEVGS